MIQNQKLLELGKIENALAPVVPSTASPKWVSLKGYGRATVIIQGSNDSTGSASAIALSQATAVAGTGAKTLGFTLVDAITDTASSDTYTSTTVASNTFNTTATASKNFIYVIDVKASDLDVANNFDCFRVTVGDASHTTISVSYILTDARYAQSADPTAILD